MLTPVGADLLLASCIFVLSRRVLSLFYFCSCVVLGSAPVKNTTAWHKERDASLVDEVDRSRQQSLLDGDYEVDEDDSLKRKIQREQRYTRCCRSLCCCLASEEEAAFEDVGKLLSDWLSDFDVVPTDMAAMLYAVHIDQHRRKVRQVHQVQERKAQEKKDNKINDEEKGMSESAAAAAATTVTSAAATLPCDPHESMERPRFGRQGLNGAVPTVKDDQRTLCRIVDNVRFAYAVYGWPLHAYDGLASCAMCRLLCCGAPCCHCCTEDIHTSYEKSGTCCQGVHRCHAYNTASMVSLAGIKSTDVIYVSWKNNIEQYSPYALMLDHKTKQVVVACRGTLSMADCLTDVLATEIPLDELGKEYGFEGRSEYGHKGIFSKGIMIVKDLVRRGYLKRLLRRGEKNVDAVVPPPKADSQWVAELPDCTGYEILITGHSLGAGLATVVALLLRQTYPELKCIAYSPPGGMLTKPLALKTRDFVTSVVLADDMISRSSIHSMFRLREEMFDAVPRMRSVNKSTMLWKIAMGADVPELLVAEDVAKKDSSTGGSKDSDVPSAAPSTAPSTESTRTPVSVRRMYPPGWILHLKQVSEERACLDTCCCNGCCCMSALMGAGSRVLQPIWLNQDGLHEIVVSRTMASDHFPDRLVAALREIRPQEEVCINVNM
jgi:sn1-specific diacylglycerol lipase